MIFYLVSAAAGRPAMLQPTQAEANREARERSLKARAPDMEHNVPTDKAGLMAYINELLAEADELRNDIAIEVGASAIIASKYETATPALQPRPAPIAEAPKFTPRVSGRDAICLEIADMSGTDLGMVALEVAARFETLGKAARNG